MAQFSQLNQEPFETLSQGETTAVTSFGGFVDAGTMLSVIPHLSEHDWLRLEYEIQLSSFSARTAEQLAANLPPPRQQNVISGVVRIPAEHTVVLGGLVSTRKDKVVEGIPFLADIPLLGEVFKNRSSGDNYETLFIFIRPVILRDENFKDLLFLSEQDIKKAKLSREKDPVNPLKMFAPVLDGQEGEG